MVFVCNVARRQTLPSSGLWAHYPTVPFRPHWRSVMLTKTWEAPRSPPSFSFITGHHKNHKENCKKKKKYKK